MEQHSAPRRPGARSRWGIKLRRDLQFGPPAVSTPTCQTGAEVEQAVRRGEVILRLDDIRTFISVQGSAAPRAVQPRSRDRVGRV